ncbi:hypothetical protein KC19_8G058200 [Ceratodon purpureus]|uniref:DUF2306 domain-containing protein n=1 Tax=Ceratodon purpureus TaxID=3225 RepID=A0A8T0GYY9_CERPU|nr:hypothetical protein KC19_8G058200 [Ceratodon purpureus]
MGNEVPNSTWMRVWANTAWWIVTIFSVPFGLYTLPFIYGKFEIYKHFTREAGLGNHHLAGLHILHNLRTWQIHAAAALLFVAIGPFQFNTSFRNNHPVLHKRFGYVFAACTVITAVTGATTMSKVTELPPIVKTLSPFMSIGTLIALTISINAARNKNFQTHRRWMMRSAAIGYSVMYTRFPLPPLIYAFTRNQDQALSYSFPLSLLLNCGLAEIYIRKYLTQSDRKRL